jgi:hypothetical protein
LFAIASDDPDAVRRVLEAGEAQATDTAGPAGQSALQFTLANKQLSKRLEIARVLLAFGAQGDDEEVPGAIDPAMKSVFLFCCAAVSVLTMKPDIMSRGRARNTRRDRRLSYIARSFGP